MKFVILGDAHGNFVNCRNVAEKNKDKIIIQIGDLGVGFVEASIISSLPPNFKFFCGNHDNRTEAHTLPNHLGDFGEYQDFFFLSGANSVDKSTRIEGVNWWPNEEITYVQGQQAIDEWEKSTTQILLAHDTPQSVAQHFYGIKDSTMTRHILQAMIQVRKPKLMIYGHHHKPKNFWFDGIRFIGLGIDQEFSLDTEQSIYLH